MFNCQIFSLGKAFSDIVVSSEKSLEVIASHALLESLLSVSGKMANAKPRAASTYREVSKPYLIHNFTGCRLSLWCDSGVSADGQPEVLEMNLNSQLPFEFEDWKTSRKGSSSKSHSLSIHLMESTWESVKGINVDRKGVFVYPLRPKLNSIAHKLVCEVELLEGIRHIILRSATCFRNDTDFDLEIQDVAAEKFSDTIKIRSGGIASLPIVFSSGGAFKVRPLGMDCDWSIQKYDLSDLFPAERKKRISKTIQCNSLNEVSFRLRKLTFNMLFLQAVPFFLSLKATSDTPEEIVFATSSLANKATSKKDRKSFYGLGTIRFCAPLVLENLIPYDFKYRVYDRESQYDFSASLEQGQLSPIHGVDTGHTIGISIDILGQGLKTKQVAVISAAPGRTIDKKIVMVDESGLEVSLYISVE
jgi:vacuolar protein sorting-associated protein 13A/C